jgi:hypothetical protein
MDLVVVRNRIRRWEGGLSREMDVSTEEINKHTVAHAQANAGEQTTRAKAAEGGTPRK